MIEITIVRDEVAGEYVVRHPWGRGGDYYSGGLDKDSRDDATGTALAIAKECGFEMNDVHIKRKVRR